MESNHEVWVVCPGCGKEYDARMESCCAVGHGSAYPSAWLRMTGESAGLRESPSTTLRMTMGMVRQYHYDNSSMD